MPHCPPSCSRLRIFDAAARQDGAWPNLARLRALRYGAAPAFPFGFGSASPYGSPSRSSASLSEGWWRWRESNSRPKWNQANFYACSRPLISEGVRRPGGLIPFHPLDSAPCSGQEELPAAWSDELCLPGYRASPSRHRGRYLGGESVIVVRNYSFFPFFNVANENPRRAI